ncbi:beta-N-acetylhexosaminidase [Acidiferrobacter sp.]|uniref:beta-N-acetylhexosaminidase n=1 Tax=Acidiferrobacter sp. TaxID=1872107 RepID=UPI0026383550|nr:beta-N-acetylhexosaminidase [Acidiferrobacter sp.]
MSLGPVMMDVVGLALSAQERERLCHPLVGGVILFSRNYESPAQLRALTAEIHALRDPPLIITVDHEGGRVQRFREGFTRLPACARIGEIHAHDHARGRDLAHAAGYVMAAELLAHGVDMSFAPVLDLGHGVSTVIGDRAFAEDPLVVTELARHYVLGMTEAGMAACGKHFPGHGGVTGDSHIELPVDDRPLSALKKADLIPFARLCPTTLAAVMPAHVVYPRVDAEPAGFSRVWLQDVLRKGQHFSGVIFSDDLSMAGAHGAGDLGARARKALAAGCDVVLACNDPDGHDGLLAALAGYSNPGSQARMTRLHGRPAWGAAEPSQDARYHACRELLLA